MTAETILIIDDRRENIVHLANNVLKPHGYRIITAMDGQRGLRRILTDKPDLVIMDLNMPKMDGLEVLTALRERQIDTIPVILTTFYGSEQVAQQAMHLGAVDYVVKPYEVDDMLQAVKKALDNRATPPPATPAEPEEVIPMTRQVERWMRDMNILNRVGKALVSNLDMDRVYARTIEAAIYITRADHAFLFLTEEGATGRLRLRAARSSQDRNVRFLDKAVDSGPAAEAIRSGKPQYWRGESDMLLTETADAILGPPIAVPLRWHKETVGALVAARDAGEPSFTELDIEWLSGLADYGAIAVRNARSCREQSQPAGQAALGPDQIATLQQELDQLLSRLQAAAKTVQALTNLLAEDS